MREVTLITPTCDRPAAFRLCERWMRRAITSYGRDVEWIVADDGSVPARCTMGQRHLRRPKPTQRAESFLGNLSLALKSATGEKILFIEDDDWYASDYIAVMLRLLDHADIAGEAHARYYNLSQRTYKIMGNASHASLCQTGIRRGLAPWMLQHIERYKRTFIDIHTWRTGARARRRRLASETTLSVGIKGLPGTPGIGRGHRTMCGAIRDNAGAVLAQWTTSEDARLYLSLDMRQPGSMKHALCILTYASNNVPDAVVARLSSAIQTLEASEYDGAVFVVDDGSTHPQQLALLASLSARYTIVRRPHNGGIARAKNTCIRVLLEHGVDVGFIAEDDVEFRPEWHRQYLAAHQAIPTLHHLSWAWDGDPSGRMNKRTVRVNGYEIARTSRLNGMLLTFTPRVIETVGGFRVLPAKWGHTHTNWTRRIIRAELCPFFADICDSNRFIHCSETARVSTFSPAEKRKLERLNRRAANDLTQIYWALEE